MSREFVESTHNAKSLADAARQQEHIRQFTKSKAPEHVTQQYLDAWAERKYQTDDHFLNWLKNTMRTEAFLTVFKHMRYPLPSAKLVNNTIKRQLERVFFAEDAYFNYTIGNELVSSPEILDSAVWHKVIFDALLFRHNDVVITKVVDVNTPARSIVKIDTVKSIRVEGDTITQIAYQATYDYEGVQVEGYAYIDAEKYAFYPNNDKKYDDLEVLHDLGRCPAHFISGKVFDATENTIVRESIFSYTIGELEEYVFLKTLQNIADAKGTFPVTTMLDTKIKKDKDNVKESPEGEPMAAKTLGGQQSDVQTANQNGSPLDAGTFYTVPLKRDNAGKLDIGYIDSFLKFFHFPVEVMEFIDKRVKALHSSIIASVVGFYSEMSESAKNELQVFYGYISKEDVLRSVAFDMTKIVSASDLDMLELQRGQNRVSVSIFFGSRFFTETIADLYESLKKSPNPVESKSLLNKLAVSRNRFNSTEAKKETIIYQLLPFCTQEDFKTALDHNAVAVETIQLQTRFNYWLNSFEARYGDLYLFWQSIEGTEAERLTVVNNLLYSLIKPIENNGENEQEQ